MNMEDTIKPKKNALKAILRAVGYFFVAIIAALAVFSISITIASKKDSDGTATAFGHQLRFVRSSSMEKCDLVDVSGYRIKDIPVRSCVFIEVVPTGEAEAGEWYSSLEVGDVLTFKYVYTKQETITHRITKITPNESNGGYTITLQGDNRSSEDGASTQTIDTSLADSGNYVVGKVVGQSYALGLLVYALRTPVGIVCIFIVPCALIIVWEVIRIARALSSERKERALAAGQEKDAEIEKLRRRIEEMSREKEGDER